MVLDKAMVTHVFDRPVPAARMILGGIPLPLAEGGMLRDQDAMRLAKVYEVHGSPSFTL
jgi:hypothetical protein